MVISPRRIFMISRLFVLLSIKTILYFIWTFWISIHYIEFLWVIVWFYRSFEKRIPRKFSSCQSFQKDDSEICLESLLLYLTWRQQFEYKAKFIRTRKKIYNWTFFANYNCCSSSLAVKFSASRIDRILWDFDFFLEFYVRQFRIRKRNFDYDTK